MEFYDFPFNCEKLSSQLTKSYFSEGWTNQDSVYRIIWNYSTRSGDYNNPRTGNPVLNQPVYWNDSRILNTAQLVKGRQTCRLTIGYKTTIARVDEGYIYKMGPPR